jgi:phage terminase large subunit-like protein
MTLHALAAGLEQIQQDATLRPLHYFRWLPAQLAFLKHAGSRVLFRAGNQAQGKTTAGVAELLYRLEGFHPYKEVRPGKITALVITATHEQSQNIQRRIHELVDPRLLTEDTIWDNSKGAYRGKYPRVRFRNGSEAVFRSGRGDTLQIAGLTVDYVWIDEPPTSMRVYSEAQKRLLRTGGDLRLTCTPVNAPVEWLRQAVEEGRIEEVHARLTVENMTPVGADSPIRLADGTLASQEWIDSIIEETLPHERPVVIHGEWRMTSLTPCFTAWDPSGMVIEAMPS